MSQQKDIKGYEGLYAITTDGRVWSYKRKIFLKPVFVKSTGYYKVNLSRDGYVSTKYIHRLVAETFIENPENKPLIDHINRVKTDNRIENLRWATYTENLRNTKSNKKVKNLDTNEEFGSIAEAVESI